ncbi:unnamed protein product [Adineta ricciae]|uniref:Uncharacterized protein n=1 Tax=Adineta ricciae TaxID=249248 RepID=A0A814XNV2_ADIRI|nr:unnamed protein product [Adineta ricciae]
MSNRYQIHHHLQLHPISRPSLEVVLSLLHHDHRYNQKTLQSPPNEHLEDVEKPLTSKEIAVLLIELRYRHSLTKSCIEHICQLLQLLKVPNAPCSFNNIESLVLCAHRSTIFPTKTIICPSCYERSSNHKRCTSTTDCDSRSSFVRAPTINYTFALEPQIRSIIERNPIVNSKTNKRSISDITHGLAYENLILSESEPFMSLLMNSDGGLVKTNSTSVWLTAFVINELPRRSRFLPENMIIGMMSTGGMKPKKEEMSVLLVDIVEELRRLENGIPVCLPSSNVKDTEQTIKIFLLASVNDKPATALLLNHKESVGYFGCSHCTIKGKSIQTGGTTVRSFAYDSKEKIILRSNETYDEVNVFFENGYKLTSTGQSFSKEMTINYLKGFKGPCIFRKLTHFDVYKSFLCDTLHNLYLGITAKILKLLLSKPSPKAGITNFMNVHDQLNSVAQLFDTISYPSTTYRQPRDIRLFKKFKGNELRIFLLFGYSIFEKVLNRERYDHLRVLAFIAHMVEGQYLSVDTHEDIQVLAEYFDERFATLYTVNEIGFVFL